MPISHLWIIISTIQDTNEKVIKRWQRKKHFADRWKLWQGIEANQCHLRRNKIKSFYRWNKEIKKFNDETFSTEQRTIKVSVSFHLLFSKNSFVRIFLFRLLASKPLLFSSIISCIPLLTFYPRFYRRRRKKSIFIQDDDHFFPSSKLFLVSFAFVQPYHHSYNNGFASK